MSAEDLRLPVGLVALISAVLYMISDLLELVSEGFSPAQLSMTYIAFVAIPFVVLGLHAIQQSRGGWLSLIGAVAYGASFASWSRHPPCTSRDSSEGKRRGYPGAAPAMTPDRPNPPPPC